MLWNYLQKYNFQINQFSIVSNTCSIMIIFYPAYSGDGAADWIGRSFFFVIASQVSRKIWFDGNSTVSIPVKTIDFSLCYIDPRISK